MLNKILHKCFKKIRVAKGKKKSPNQVDDLLDRRRLLKNSINPNDRKELEDIEERLANLLGEEYLQTIEKEMEEIRLDDGKVNTQKIWQMKKKLCPKIKDSVATAKLDNKGNVITTEHGTVVYRIR